MTDRNGGMITIDGVSRGQCDMFIGKKIIWETNGEKIESEIAKSKEVEKL